MGSGGAMNGHLPLPLRTSISTHPCLIIICIRMESSARAEDTIFTCGGSSGTRSFHLPCRLSSSTKDVSKARYVLFSCETKDVALRLPEHGRICFHRGSPNGVNLKLRWGVVRRSGGTAITRAITTGGGNPRLSLNSANAYGKGGMQAKGRPGFIDPTQPTSQGFCFQLKEI
ncbi:hypothetical protein DFP72DRAFT_263314 [Ephemerocybe angulata]|uniref:Uncharacterized protein n=1 Tax=Ephemerocybe angulata TaxID=980116 RepID=A0A8H6I1D9_9AGAR|nr:hypothetical protein DFP72DRAFT_263314 [Tulosesus angulatus]